MGFGFPPHYEESRKYDVAAEKLAAAVRATLDKFGWSHQDESTYEISAHSPLSGFSWGENLMISIGMTGELTVQSKCSGGFNMFQIIDYGKNKRNVLELFASVESIIGGK